MALSLHRNSAESRAINREDLQNGAVVQLVRIHACHAWGRGFESRPHRRTRVPIQYESGLFLFSYDSYIILYVIRFVSALHKSSSAFKVQRIPFHLSATTRHIQKRKHYLQLFLYTAIFVYL